MLKKIGNEYELIDYMYKNEKRYFKFDIIATEVSFKNCLKAVDMLGEDDTYYYAIEFKREHISREDFCNVKYIIENSYYDKPIRGLLVGTKISDNLLELIKYENNIDYLIINDVKYDKSIHNVNNKKYNINVWKMGNAIKFLFEISCGRYMKCISFSYSGEIMILNFYLSNELKIYIKYYNKKHIISVLQKDRIYNEWRFVHEWGINCSRLDSIIFRLKNEYSINKIVENNTFLKRYKNCEYREHRERYKYTDKNLDLLEILTNYISLNVLAKYIKNDELIIDTYTGINFLPDIRGDCCIIPLIYSYIFKNEIKHMCIKNVKEYNIINILESTRIIIDNKLYKPLTKAEIGLEYVKIKMIIELNDGRKVSKIYTRKSLPWAIKYELYLICEIDIILDFEMHVKKYINNKTHIQEKYIDIVNQYLYSKFKKKEENKSIREFINDIPNDLKAEIKKVKGHDGYHW